MKKVWAKPGSFEQTYARNCPDGFIEMNNSRPNSDYIAENDGSWASGTLIMERNKRLSAKEFMELFTLEELIAIHNHAESAINVKIWLNRLVGAEYVVRTDQSLQEGMAYMVFQNLITNERHDNIMKKN